VEDFDGWSVTDFSSTSVAFFVLARSRWVAMHNPHNLKERLQMTVISNMKFKIKMNMFTAFRKLLVVGSLALLVSAVQGGDDKEPSASVMQTLREAHPLWLRERCTEPFYADVDTKQPHYNLHTEETDLVVLDVAKDDEREGFIVMFSDQKSCFFAETAIRAELQNEQVFLQVSEWGFPPRFTWDKSLVSPPFFEHDDIIDESDQTRKFLSNLISTGIAVISGVPREEGECARFGERFTSLRETEWGKNFNVRSTPDMGSGGVQKKDLAYTSNAIGMHVDSPYRIDTPPSFQLLHAIDHCHGPDCYVHNQFVDGFAVAAALCESDRAAFQILTEVTLRWENNGGDGRSLLFRYAPMIELDGSANSFNVSDSCPSVDSINFSAKSGGYAPNLPRDRLDSFYEAKRKFSSLLHSDEYTVRVQLYPGALVMFDNRRVLHSRSNIADTDGDRWLQGCYLNRDGVNVMYERMRRKFRNLTETPFTSLEQATKADFDRMGVEYDKEVAQKTVSNLVRLLEGQKSDSAFLGAPVSLFEHNVQTASRAFRAGEDDETIAVSLFHDVFETLAVKNHGELVAAMLAPWVSPKSQWLLAHHEIFQGYYYFEDYGLDKNKRDMFVNHPFYNWTVEWCHKYDQISFDPDYPSLPMAQLLPVVERVLSRAQYWWNPSHPKAGAMSAQAELTAVDEEDTGDAISGAHREACEDTWTCYDSGMNNYGEIPVSAPSSHYY
jgi:gamma-butyrobetaine dioxygenase